jgi:hypothetical protein
MQCIFIVLYKNFIVATTGVLRALGARQGAVECSGFMLNNLAALTGLSSEEKVAQQQLELHGGFTIMSEMT